MISAVRRSAGEPAASAWSIRIRVGADRPGRAGAYAGYTPAKETIAGQGGQCDVLVAVLVGEIGCGLGEAVGGEACAGDHAYSVT